MYDLTVAHNLLECYDVEREWTFFINWIYWNGNSLPFCSFLFTGYSCTFMWGWMYSRRHPFLALPPRVGFIFTPLWSSGHWSVISLFHGFLHLLDVPVRATWATILRNRSSFWHMTSWLMVGKISAFGSSTLIRQSFQFNLMFVILWNCRISRDSIHEFPLSLQLFKMS